MDITRKKRSDLVVRFHAGYVVNEVTGCWEWKKNIQANGYGHIKEGGKAKLAHRVSFALHKGPIPEGAYVLHKCDNRCCVNPLHLFVGTALDNRIDMQSKMRHAHGERVNTAKLTEKEVLEIYAMSDSGVGSKRIGAKYGVSTTMAWNIKTGRSWSHLFKARYGTNDPV